MADHDYLAIFHQILMPIASEVNIKLIWTYIFIQQYVLKLYHNLKKKRNLIGNKTDIILINSHLFENDKFKEIFQSKGFVISMLGNTDVLF